MTLGCGVNGCVRTSVPRWIAPDSSWERIEPLLPEVERRKRHAGRKRLDDRWVLCGISFVLHTGSGGSSSPRSRCAGRA
ncbi:transposase [Actinomadura nitritigenes]|uniref:transposase n=1 Tax=Actinomadura nitritigenes TaxID=134602 RepID=UPI003D8FC9A4